MNQWIYIKYIFVLILVSKFSYQIDIESKSEFNLLTSNHSDFAIEPTKLQIKYVSFSNANPFSFKSPVANKDLLVHFYSINCDIDINDSTGKATKRKIQNDTFSFLIKSNFTASVRLVAKPILNILDDINSKHSTSRTCPIVINSVYINDFTLIEDDKEIVALLFGTNLKKLTYQMSNTKKNNFIAFSFMFDNIASFNVTTPDGSIRVISNSTKLFFDSDYLEKLNKTTITITITPRSTNEVLLFLKVIESDSISMLQKNYLNQGFITSNTTNQYYFMEIFNEEEGEIMLHNKRQNGELFGIIKPKSINPYNISEYLLNNELNNSLEFDNHNQKLSFKSLETENCEKGCYLLITFVHQENVSHIPIVGFEFTLLARIWDEENYLNTPIINIAFNEYIFGSFEAQSINHHYYSLFVPDGTDKIIIQMEGNYFDGFIGDGKRKLNTFKNTTEKLVMINNKNLVKIYNKADLQNLKYYNNYISFSFRSKDYFTDTFSFYYFRVIQIKSNESLIYPLDSNVGDICLPELDQNLNKYYCYFSLRNDYNEFSLGYSVSYPNQNENYNITAYKYKKDGTTIVNSSTNYFEDNSTDYSFIILKVEFNDDDNEYILSTFIDADEDINPQIYMNQLFYIKETTKFVEFKLKYTFTLILKYIKGSGSVILDNTGNFPNISANYNYKGKPFCFPLSDIKKINIKTSNNFTFVTKLDYIMKDIEIREIFSDELIYEIFIKKNLPIYYYMKYKRGQEIDINFKILKYDDDDKSTITNFYIKGYFLNEDNIKRKINGDIIDLKDPINGQFDPSYGFGILKIKNNQTIFNNSTEDEIGYLLIEINSKNNFISSNISIEILGIVKNNDYKIVPINLNLQEYIEPNKTKNYLMRITDIRNETMFEVSSNIEDIEVGVNYNNCLKENYETGVLKYRCIKLTHDLHLNVSSNKIIDFATYNLRFFGTNKSKEYEYIFDKSSKVINETILKDNNSLSISFDNLNIINNYARLDPLKNKVVFQVYGYLLDENNIRQGEILNTTSLISSSIDYKNKTIVTYGNETNFTLYFENIKIIPSYLLKLNIHVTIGNFLFNEDFLSYAIPIDLSPYIPNENKKDDSQDNNIVFVIILVVSLLLVIIIIIVVFSIIYMKLKGKNKTLEERVLSVEMLNADKKKKKTVFV